MIESCYEVWGDRCLRGITQYLGESIQERLLNSIVACLVWDVCRSSFDSFTLRTALFVWSHLEWHSLLIDTFPLNRESHEESRLSPRLLLALGNLDKLPELPSLVESLHFLELLKIFPKERILHANKSSFGLVGGVCKFLWAMDY